MTTTGGEDRLSELSDDLLQRILYFVPSKEAASTSLLSRRWGSLWRSSGAVNFAVQVHGYRHLEYGPGYKEAEEAFFTKRDAFVRGAKAALDAAEAGVPITRLTLRVETDDHAFDSDRTIDQFLCRSRDWHTDADVVGAVVSHPAARCVEELRVAIVDVNNIYHYFEEENHRLSGIYGLASLPSSDTLCVLDLTRCDLTKMAAGAVSPLPRLATLRLRYCSIYRNVVQALLDAATELATVKLESVVFVSPPESKPKPQPQVYWPQVHHNEDELEDDEAKPEPPVLRLSFQAATTTLVMTLCGMPDEQDSGDHRGRSRWVIEIDAPRLQSFKYKGLMRRFILRPPAAHGVAHVDLHFLRQRELDRRYHQHDNDDDDEKETTSMLFWQFLHNFTYSRTLKLKVENELKDIAVTGKAMRARLLCVFPRVERLELEGVHSPKSKTAAVAIANLLHCCPVLGEIMLKLSTVTGRHDQDHRYADDFLERKDRSDYTKSMDRFMRRRWKSKTAMSMEDSGGFGDIKYDDVPSIPGLSGRSFACLQHTLRRVRLQFRLDNSSMSSCLGLRLIKFFADHARVLEEMFVDTGNRRLDEHLNFNVETQVALAPKPISATISIQHKNLAETSSECSRISIVPSLDSTTDLAKNTVSFTVLPLQRQERMDRKP